MKIKEVQDFLKKDYDCFIVYTEDPHKSEYPTNHFKIREYLSGFTGSSGVLIITKERAGLWTDFRYFIQAEFELKNSDITLFKQGEEGVLDYATWIFENLKEKDKVLIDPKFISLQEYDRLKAMFDKKNINIVLKECSFIDDIWTDREKLPATPLYKMPLEYVKYDAEYKIKEVLNEIKQDYYLISSLDNIAWILNLRAKDIENNSVFYSYLLLSKNQNHKLFIDSSRINKDILQDLKNNKIDIYPYEALKNELNKLKKVKIYLDFNASMYTRSSLNDVAITINKDIIAYKKAIKNECEIKSIKQAHIKDAIALVKTFYKLENDFENEIYYDECEISDLLLKHRAQDEDFTQASFDSIVGFKGNGAIVHYRPEKETCKKVNEDGCLLIDSGGQYLQGTTDITRTWYLGKSNIPEIKKAYTLVLKGHLSLGNAVFLQGTTGGNLDILARMHLWRHGLNYGHGTGHGVGHNLGVHEGPYGISLRSNLELKAGTLLSNEPGFYKKGEFGIRIESLILIKEAYFKNYLCFETVTVFPINKTLIDQTLLSKEDIDNLNKYHKQVYDTLEPLIEDKYKNWLKEKTANI